MQTKQKIRAQILAARKPSPQKSAEICENIRFLPEYTAAEQFLSFMPKENEVDVLPLWLLAFHDKKSTFMPVTKSGGEILFYEAKPTSKDSMVLDKYGILVPPEGETPDFSKKTICVVPCLAAGESGHRLGYGRGYYDRFFSQLAKLQTPNFTSAAVCYEEFLIYFKPDPHDVPVNYVITEERIITI